MKLRKKRLQEAEKETDEKVKQASGIAPAGPFQSFKMQANADILSRGLEIGPVKDNKQEERTWFDSGAFDDGYQFGDVARTILGSGADLLENIGSGIIGMGEAAVDAFATISPYVMQSQMSQVPVFDEKLRQKQENLVQQAVDETQEFVSKDLYDEEKVSKAIITNPLRDLTGIDAEKDSVFGERSDALAQSAGQLAATFGLNMVGVPWFVTTGVTSFGSEAENATKQGASLSEAMTSGFISAGAEVLSEKLFGGDLFVKGAGADIATTFLSTAISNKTWRTMVKLGMDTAGEGVEEVFSQVVSNLGSALYKEKDLGEILFDEEALDGYIESFIGGAVLGGGMSAINVAQSHKAGKDYVTDLTKNEQAVVDKVYQDRVAEAEKSGKISQKEKGKIYNEVIDELEKGYISTDTIEEVLGGEEFENYNQIKQKEDALRQEYDTWSQEYDELYNMKNGDKSSKQVDREAELKRLLEDRKKFLDSSSFVESTKSKLSENVFSMVSGDRLAESYHERSRRGQAFEADLSQYDQKQQAVIKKAIDSGVLNNTRRTHDFVNMVAKISADKGVAFDFTNNAKLKESGFAMDGKTVNGFVTKDGITINTQSSKYVNSVVGHEITHVLEGTELYAELQSAVFEYAKARNDYQGRYDSLTKLYQNVKDADINAELTADLVGDYLFTDSDFVSRLSTEHRNIFQKIYDEVKYLFKVATAGSKEARELEKVKRAFDKAYRESGKAQSETKYSLTEVEPVQPKNGKWSRTHTTEEAMARFPNMWNVAAEESEVRNPTQIVSTVNSYRKIYNFLQNEGFNGTILDASSGLGYGTRAGIEEYGFDVEDIEPYPDKGYNPKYQDYSTLDKKYDVIISNAVLNVLPQDQRDALAVKMGQMLNDGGRLFVNVRGKDVESLAKTGKNIHLGNMEWIETVKGSYQKGFTKPELVAYLQDALGDGFTVKPTNMFGAVSAVVTKNGVKYSLSDSDGKKLTNEQQEYFKDSKMRDEKGNLMVMYHGSQDAGFHVFDPGMSDDGTSFFFVDRNDVAATYSGTTETYEAKAFTSPEDANKFFEKIGKGEYFVDEKNGKYRLRIDEGPSYYTVAESESIADLYDEFCDYEGVGYGDANYKVYLNLKNPLVVDAQGRNWNRISGEFSQEIYDRYKSLTEGEREALIQLASWEDASIFRDELLTAVESVERGASYVDDYTKTLASAAEKLGDADMYRLFDIAADYFSEESLRENAVQYLKTRDYAQRAKDQGYDGVIFKNIVDLGGYAAGNEGASTVAIAFDSNQIKSVANGKPTGDADIRYSLSDNQGNQLTNEQAEYFQDSKIRDADGNLKVMHHGSGEAFTVFDKKKARSSGYYGSGFYFTDSESHAKQYGNTYDVYLNITNPLQDGTKNITKDQLRKFVEAVAENEDYGIENYGYGATVDSVVDNVYGKSDFAMLMDINASCVGNMVEAIELFNEVNGTDYNGIVAATETVAFYPEQIKRVDNANPTADPDIRFSLSEAVEETKDLMALHNLTEEKLLKGLKLGGMPMPSVAIARARDGHGEFGDITLILHKDAIDPKTSRKNKLYSGDAWTPTYPSVAYKPSEKVLKKVKNKISGLVPYDVQTVLGSLMFDTDNASSYLDRYNGNMVEAYKNNDAMKYAYLKDTGSDISLPMKEADLYHYGAVSNAAVRYFSGKLVNGLQTVNLYRNMSARDLLQDKALVEAVADAQNFDVLRTLEPGSDEYLEYERNPVFRADEVAFRDIDEFLSAARKLFTNGVQQTVDRKAAKELINGTVDQAAYENWLEELFQGVVEKEGIRNNKDYFTPSGNRRSFEALHYEHNLENVIKAMREQGEKGIGNGFGGASIFGASTTEFSSIEEMKQSRNRLQTMSYDEYQEMRKGFTDRFLEIAMSLPNQKNSFSATDSAAEVLTEAVAKYKTRSGIANYLRRELKGWATYSDQAVDDLISLVNDIRNMPTGYFEAKPQRAVGFDEVGVFVVPNNVNPKLKQELLNRGYSIAEYDPNVEGDRQRVVNQFEAYKFSLSAPGEQPKRFGNYHVSGKDIAFEAPTAIVSETESVAPVAEEAPAAPVAVEETAATTEDLFPDDLAPAQAELEYLEAEAADIQGAMEAFAAVGDVDGVNRLIPELEGVKAKIDELRRSESEQFEALSDSDAPPETEALYPGESSTVSDPFADRDMKDVGNRKVKAYMYENPEVKPYFQEAALGMLGDLHSGTRGEKWYNDEVYYASGGEKGWGGTKRHTTDDIAELLDIWHYTYDQIEKGLNAIIEDNGAENNAVSKRIEFMLNDRLMNGYTDPWGEPIPANQEYIDFLRERQITQYSREAFESLFANADQYAPPGEDIGPVASPAAPVVPSPMAPTETINTDSKKGVIKGQQTYIPQIPPQRSGPATEFTAPMYEAHTSKGGQVKGQQSVLKDAIRNESDRVAQVLTEEPAPDKKKGGFMSWIKNNVFDRGMVFEDLSIETGNRELQARWNSTRYAEGKAQKLIGEGNATVSSLASIQEDMQRSGKTKQFYEYLYHLHNVDRMTLEERFGVENKSVFGDTITAEVSKDAAERLLKANPEFKAFAEDVYAYNRYLRELLVDGGVISRQTARLWERMYPHYVPIRRAGQTGLNINVPLDTGRTGVNAPIKKATGGSSDILPLFDTMAQRTIQTYKAIAKNRFGVELKNTLGTTIAQDAASLDETIDSIDNHDELLKKGEKGQKPTFTVFENGKRVTFEITEEMYDAMKPADEILNKTVKPLNIASTIFRNLTTQYNPTFMLTNPIKDIQDVLINSQHPLQTYMSIPKALAQMSTNGHYYEEYLANGGDENTYFDNETNTIKVEKVPAWLDVIGNANNAIERLPRLAEYIASREAGASIDVAMLDAARVTTNFAAGGALTKFLNRNGATFLNASVQGAVQQVRNVREAKRNGVKGWVSLAAKCLAAGIPAMVLNNLLWDDDEEYEELSDYVKQNYYVVGKYDDGKFIRIPKGRTVAVIQNAFEQMGNLITGDDEVDLGTFLELAISNLAPNNPLDNNIIAPIMQVANNKTWYGEDLIPTRLQDLPAAEQYDESTDEFSKWLGGLIDYSPYKINYLLDQYGGGLADMLLPPLTPEAENGDSSILGTITAPFRDKFTTDSVMNNQNVSDFYDLKDELTVNANGMRATDEDKLKAKYMNSISSELAKLYQQKREIQNGSWSDERKYEAVRDIQQQIVDLMKEGMSSYGNISYEDDYRGGGEYARVGNRVYKRDENGEWSKLSDDQLTKYEVTRAAGDAAYATDGENHYRWYVPGEDASEDAKPEWRKITADQLEKQEEVTGGLGISPEDYWENKDEYDYAYDHPENYAVAKAVGGYKAYKTYTSELYDIKADKDEYGKSISGSRKEKVLDYINGLDIPYEEKLILFKSEYNADDTYNYEIIDYLNGNEDISYDDMVAILKKLGFNVDSKGNITW